MIETERLILRRWRDADRTAFAAMNADPHVMAHFPEPLERPGSDALMARLDARWQDEGIAFAAVERKADGALLGMAGLAVVRFDSPVLGNTEIGWRFARTAWGEGYATEAARGWLAHGFETRGLGEIVAFTAPANAKSRAVMVRLGMRRDRARDFDHPALPEVHRLRPHHVYALTRDARAPGRGVAIGDRPFRA